MFLRNVNIVYFNLFLKVNRIKLWKIIKLFLDYDNYLIDGVEGINRVCVEIVFFKK